MIDIVSRWFVSPRQGAYEGWAHSCWSRVKVLINGRSMSEVLIYGRQNPVLRHSAMCGTGINPPGQLDSLSGSNRCVSTPTRTRWKDNQANGSAKIPGVSG